jgi:DNA invertase Pin-like site-specific DNA recombinase
MKTAYYYRASSKSQDLKSQRADMEAHAASEPNAAFYRDRFTGTTLERPGWSRLWADVLAEVGSACPHRIGPIAAV